MGFFERFRQWFKRDEQENGVPLPVEPQMLGNIMVRAEDDEQRNLVLATVGHLSTIWPEGVYRGMLQVMVMVDEAYPHMARMGRLDAYSAEWMTDLSEAVRVTEEGAERIVEEQNRLREALDNLKGPKE